MDPPRTIMQDPRIVWHASDTPARWAEDAALAIAACLRDASRTQPRTRLLLSGGSTPAPVYRALAETGVDWSRVDIGLVDERDVEPDAEGSNARLVDETLLEGLRVRGWSIIDAAHVLPDAALQARQAGSHESAGEVHFHPLRRSRQSLAAALAAANRDPRLDPQQGVLVLGMGDDGHTASLFPGARNLEATLASSAAYAVIDAEGCKVAGAYPRRISLTASGIAQAVARILLLRGERKRDVFAQALRPGHVHEYPIRAAIEVGGSPLHVYWCRD